MLNCAFRPATGVVVLEPVLLSSRIACKRCRAYLAEGVRLNFYSGDGLRLDVSINNLGLFAGVGGRERPAAEAEIEYEEGLKLAIICRCAGESGGRTCYI